MFIRFLNIIKYLKIKQEKILIITLKFLYFGCSLFVKNFLLIIVVKLILN